jgi:hypothetical protein
MGINVIDAVHVRVTCDACRESAELCGKRLLAGEAVELLARRFRALAWHSDPARRKGGPERWYCPTCARRAHG